jgi:malonate transporter and related proteins
MSSTLPCRSSGLMLAGAVAARLFQIEERTGDRLNILVLYFALPAMIYRTVASAPSSTCSTGRSFSPRRFRRSSSLWPPSASPCGSSGRVHVAGAPGVLGELRQCRLHGAGPVRRGVRRGGRGAGHPHLLLRRPDPVHAGAAGRRHRHDGPRGRRGALGRNIARSVLLHPFFVAAAAGAVSSAIGLQLPTALDTFVEMLSRAAAPSALFALGITCRSAALPA